MTTHEISAPAITANLTTSVEQQLAEVRDKIRELREAETVLLNVLTTLRAGAAAVPTPRHSAAEAHHSPASDRPAAQQDADAEQPGPARRGRRRAAAGKTPSGSAGKPAKAAAGGRAHRDGKAGSGGESEPVRVLRFLLPLREPQTAAEIARGLYPESAGQAEINRVRSAAESLTRRGALEKTRQGSTVFYQVADAAPGVAAVLEDSPESDGTGGE